MSSFDTKVVDFSSFQPNNKKMTDKFSGDGGGGNMEARIAKLESDVEYIKTNISEIKQDIRDIKIDNKSDFRILFGAIITVTLGLAGLLAKGFGWL